MNKIIIFIFLVVPTFASANSHKADCINAIIRDASNSSQLSYLSDFDALIEYNDGAQWIYVDNGASYTYEPEQQFACVPASRNSEKDLTRKVISVFESSLSAHDNPSYYVNTLLAPCRRSNIRPLIDRLNMLSSQPRGTIDTEAID